MPKNSYVCPRCGYVLPKEDAVVSGFDSQSSPKHIHCPRYGKIITHARASKDFIMNEPATDTCAKILAGGVGFV